MSRHLLRPGLFSALLALVLALTARPASAQFASSEVSAPGSASPFQLSKTGWRWEDLGGVTYSIYRSDRPDSGFACILDMHPFATWTGDQDAFPPTRLWHYLVTAYDGADDNSPGRRSDGAPRTLDLRCPRQQACCLPDSSCLDLERADCAAQGGSMQGAGTTCATVTCPAPTEACCLAGPTGLACEDLAPDDCAARCGLSQGPGTACATTACVQRPLQLVPIGANFTSPIFLTAPAGDDRLFVLERAGRIVLQRGDGTRTTFLDISTQVRTGGERGALGLAFHPGYATNGRFYVHYSRAATGGCGPDHCSTISEFTVSGDPDLADAASERVVLQVGQPFGNHNGGWIDFGPDGFLYIAFGDGGSAGDPLESGQNLGSLLGKLLRIDVDGRDAGLQYAIPPDNPFVAQAGARGEVWSWGLRNPWRNCFDRDTGDLYIADVGQNRIEEVDVATAASGAGRGVNYGWDEMEGSDCYEPATGCDTTGKVLPDHEYTHAEGCSITGGYVYRGCRMPDWNGWYFFSDYCGEWIDAFQHAAGVASSLQRVFPGGATNAPVSFGEDADGELYVIDPAGPVLRLDPR